MMRRRTDGMTLLDLKDAYPDLIYVSNNWAVREAFMRILPDPDAPSSPPRRVSHTGQVPKAGAQLPHAVDLAHAFLKTPTDPVWLRWLWCADTDAQGQRVFVGVEDGRFQIHRHLAITERWGQPSW